MNIEKIVKLCTPECQAINPRVSEWKRLLFLENIFLDYCIIIMNIYKFCN